MRAAAGVFAALDPGHTSSEEVGKWQATGVFAALDPGHTSRQSLLPQSHPRARRVTESGVLPVVPSSSSAQTNESMACSFRSTTEERENFRQILCRSGDRHYGGVTIFPLPPSPYRLPLSSEALSRRRTSRATFLSFFSTSGNPSRIASRRYG